MNITRKYFKSFKINEIPEEYDCSFFKVSIFVLNLNISRAIRVTVTEKG